MQTNHLSIERTGLARILLAAVGVHLAASAAVLAQPANNNCASATTLSGNGPTMTPGTTAMGATSDGTASCEGPPGNPDVWYTIVPPCSGTLGLSTCGGLNTVLSVHTGTCGALTEVAGGCNNDCPGVPCAGTGSCLLVTVSGGVPYRIRVASIGATGDFTLTHQFTDTIPPTITACAINQTVTGTTGNPCLAMVPSFTGAPLAATDNCAGTVTFTQSPVAGTFVCSGDTTITVTATDVAGNTATCTATLHVNCTAPSLPSAARPEFWVTDGTVLAVAYSAGVVYIGGTFNTVLPPPGMPGTPQPRTNIAALSAATGVPTAWDPSAMGGAVRALAVSNAKVYAGGDFTMIGTAARNRIAALEVGSGMADLNWNPNADSTVNALAVFGNTVYAGGAFTTMHGQTRRRIAAIEPANGSNMGIPTLWDPNITNGAVLTLRASGPPDANGLPALVYAGGTFTTVGAAGNTQTRNAIAALRGTDGVATAWKPNAQGGAVNAIAVDAADGKVYVGGAFTSIGEQQLNRLAKLDAAGFGTAAVPLWNPNPNGVVNALSLSGSGPSALVYAGGAFTMIGAAPMMLNGLAALRANNAMTPDTFNPNFGGGGIVFALAGVDFTALTELLAGGTFTTIGGSSRPNLGAFGTNCTRWTGAINNLWSTGGNWSTGVVPDGAGVCVEITGTGANVTLDDSGDQLRIVSSLALDAGTLILNDASLRLSSSGGIFDAGNIGVGTGQQIDAAMPCTLAGSGTLTLNGGTLASTAGNTIVNCTGHTINGMGMINAELRNLGTIDASSSTNTLTLSGSSITSEGDIKASGGGTMQLNTGVNTGGGGGRVMAAGGTLMTSTITYCECIGGIFGSPATLQLNGATINTRRLDLSGNGVDAIQFMVTGSSVIAVRDSLTCNLTQGVDQWSWSSNSTLRLTGGVGLPDNNPGGYTQIETVGAMGGSSTGFGGIPNIVVTPGAHAILVNHAPNGGGAMEALNVGALAFMDTAGRVSTNDMAHNVVPFVPPASTGGGAVIPLPEDNTPPTITQCAPNTTLCPGYLTDLTALIMATDNLPGTVTVTQSPGVGTPLGPLGSMTVVTFTARDASGNTATCQATMTVADTMPRTSVSCPAVQRSVNANCQYVLENLTDQAIVVDNCAQGLLTRTQNPLPGFIFSGLGLHPNAVTITVTDSGGNMGSCNINLTLVDTTPPSITTCAANQTVPGGGNPCQATVPNFTGSPLAATDNCTATGSLIKTQNPTAGSTALQSNSPVTVTITVADATGNTATCTATLTISPCAAEIPTMSEWGLIILSLLTLAGGMIVVARRTAAEPGDAA